MNPEIYSQADAYCRNLAQVQKVAYEPETGLMDLADLEEKLQSGEVAAVFYENPSYLGFFETRGQEIADLAHRYGAFVSPSRKWRLLGSWRAP
mgnify:CR=1 FL=1